MKLAALILAVLAAAAGGCDDDSSAPIDLDDLSVPAVDDLQAPADLAPPPVDAALVCVGGPPPDAFVPSTDAGAFCVGTSLAGTCAQAFFERIYDCFAPAGCCVSAPYGLHHGAHIEYYWANGATSIDQRVASPVDGINYPGRSWGMCATASCGRVELGGGPGATDKWSLPDGTVMIVNPATGDVTCPDNSQTNIGPGYEQCAEMTLRLDVMHKGTPVYDCPADYSKPNSCQ